MAGETLFFCNLCSGPCQQLELPPAQLKEAAEKPGFFGRITERLRLPFKAR
jgi:hypothetical protein